MAKAYLQNKKAQYYYIAGDGTVALCDDKKALQQLPQIMDAAEELIPGQQKYQAFTRAGFIFKNDGLRILSHIFFKKGIEGDCILTMEQDINICGDLDFSTARIMSSKKEISICCVLF